MSCILATLLPPSMRRPDQLLVPDTVFFASEERPSVVQDEMEESAEKYEDQQRRSTWQRCNSDSVLRATNPDEIRRGHEQLCIRRAEAVKQRGISLLNEVDAQYSALQVVYMSHACICHLSVGGLLQNVVLIFRSLSKNDFLVNCRRLFS